jgi:nucleotide-binding universal stress UspA family protein
MPTLRHILFPYDFSAKGDHVVPFVRDLAARFGARLTLLAVVPPAYDPVPESMGGSQLHAGEDSTEWRRRLQERLDGALVEELASTTTDRVVEGGDPAIRIVDFAHGHGVDLIMMPTHGVGTFRNLLLGSVTSKVLHDATCPVWTAAHAETQTTPTLPRTVLCAVDGSEAAPAVLRWAAGFAASLGARLNLVHVVASISDWPTLESERRLQEHLRDHAREKIAALVKSSGVDVPARVAVGAIAETVAEEARQEQAELIVIGRGSVAGAFSQLRAHAFGIIQQSPCPVLSV